MKIFNAVIAIVGYALFLVGLIWLYKLFLEKAADMHFSHKEMSA